VTHNDLRHNNALVLGNLGLHR